MSVTQQHPFHFRPRASTPRARKAGQFEELDVRIEPAAVEFVYTHDNATTQNIVLWCSTFIFMVFVVSIIPMMQLTAISNAIALVLGLLVLVTIGLVMQARVRTTLVRLGTAGIRVEQGTTLDRETIDVAWKDLAGVELEPIDPKNERKGMHLELRPHTGEPVKILAGIGVGDLSAVRQAILKAWRGSQP